MRRNDLFFLIALVLTVAGVAGGLWWGQTRNAETAAQGETDGPNIGGPFTLVESGKVKWVYEDKSNLRFAVGETFTLVAVYDPSKPQATLPEDLKQYPLLKLVAVR